MTLSFSQPLQVAAGIPGLAENDLKTQEIEQITNYTSSAILENNAIGRWGETLSDCKKETIQYGIVSLSDSQGHQTKYNLS